MFAIAMSEALTLICLRVEPDMTNADVKEIAEELFPYRMGQNANIRIRSQGEACLRNMK